MEFDPQCDRRGHRHGIAVEIGQRSRHIESGGHARDVIERHETRAIDVVRDRRVLRDPDEAGGIGIDLEHDGCACGADNGAGNIRVQKDVGAVQRVQSGINTLNWSAVGVGDRERVSPLLVGPDLAREQ